MGGQAAIRSAIGEVGRGGGAGHNGTKIMRLQEPDRSRPVGRRARRDVRTEEERDSYVAGCVALVLDSVGAGAVRRLRR